MLRIDRHEAYAVLPSKRHNDVSGTDYRLFICLSYILARLDSLDSGQDAYHTYNTDQHGVRVLPCRALYETLHAAYYLHGISLKSQSFLKLKCLLLIVDAADLRLEFHDLLIYKLCIAVGCKPGNMYIAAVFGKL